MRGTKPGFWKNYEKQQVAMMASCMPRVAKTSGVEPMKIQAPLAVCPLPGRLLSDPFANEILGLR
jgi:hypothetical protein